MTDRERVSSDQPRPEVLLERYLKTRDGFESEQLLVRLVFDHAEPVARRIAAYRLRAQEVEDVCGEIVLELISRLGAMKTGRETGVWTSFAGYVATAAYHACHEYLRHRYPQRHRLKARLRRMLGSEPGLAVWESEHGEWLCGRTEYRGRPKAASCDLPPNTGQDLPALVREILERSNGPVELDDLVSAVAQLTGVTDRTELADADLPAQHTSAEQMFDQRVRLERLWTEICQLPLNQRIALLFNLREEDGGSALALLPITGVASIRQIAAALEIPAGEFAELWNRMPISDLEIAGRLRLTRQQAINLRKSARQRLARRMGW